MSTTPFILKVLEHCKVSPPKNTTPTTSSLPLTFFDLPWLFFSPSQPLFFYEFPHTTYDFTNTIVPKLKHSLSLTLQHYYPFVGTFVPSNDLTKPQINFTNNNSIPFTISESNGDFKYLCSNHSKDVKKLHLLVPKLSPKLSFSCEVKDFPLLAIQVTTFPKVGFSIGLSFHHVVCDGRTFHNFFKTWTYYCSTLGTSLPLQLESLPFYDRSVIIDTKGIHEVFLKDWKKRRLVKQNNKVDFASMVRATFLMGASEMEKIKSFILDSCKQKKVSQPLHLSPYVLTCAFLWVCLVKTQRGDLSGVLGSPHDLTEDPAHFGFIAGGLTRLEYQVPKTYLGNCVGFGRASLNKNELLGEDGIIIAAKAIGSKIKKLDASIFEGAEKWILDWEVLLDGSEKHVHVTWSPKLKLYDESNFGWGRPKKIEEVSIDSTRGVSLLQSRDVEGGIEIGLSLPKNKMDNFTILFTKGLEALP